jgi:hypothetical protein
MYTNINFKKCFFSSLRIRSISPAIHKKRSYNPEPKKPDSSKNPSKMIFKYKKSGVNYRRK